MGALWSSSDSGTNETGWDKEQIDVLTDLTETQCNEGGVIDEAAPSIVIRPREEAVRRRTGTLGLSSSQYGVGWDGANPSLDSPLESSAKRTVHMSPIPGVPSYDLTHKAVTQTLSKHEELFKVVTPIHSKELQTMLRSHPNREFVKSLIDGFKNGFWPGANTSRMNSSRPTDLDPAARRPRDTEQVSFLRKQLEHEISKDRYSTSFGAELLPGMTCTPIFTKPKPGPKKFRLINNHSAGESSLNSLIPSSAAYVQVDTLTHLATSLRRAVNRHGKPPAYLFTSDVAEAFRLIPIHPRWQVRQVNRIDGKLYVDRNAVFGNRGSMRLFCLFFAAVAWCAENKLGLEDIFHYVDDSFSYDFEETLVPYRPHGREMPKKQVALLGLFDRLGIPHEERKQKFGKEIVVIGFLVSVTNLTISLPKDKLTELRDMIRTFLKKRAQPLKDWWELLGVANWTLQAAPKLKPALYSSFDAISGKTKQNEKVFLTDEIISDLNWFSQHLGKARPIGIMDGGPWEKGQEDLRVHCWLSDGVARIVCPARTFASDKALSSGPNPIECREACCIFLALQWAAQRRPKVVRDPSVIVHDPSGPAPPKERRKPGNNQKNLSGPLAGYAIANS